MDSYQTKTVPETENLPSSSQLTFQENIQLRKQNIVERLKNIPTIYFIVHAVIVFILSLACFIALVSYEIFLFNVFILICLYITAGVSTILMGKNFKFYFKKIKF